ncbi:diphthamide biosynthesis [Moniliophthora roreri MCA 2997]|uniref:2-(3-amino-3-carboxypropyl)histidine synthase subunit 2 n=1 Tax=Moniliophthora roreri (strain MCA 2997) TaxID=1381753 RepID=V2YI10_MONRO|nr:diphthamide biosynthesis [Moniliophthora roreri MCA 2997]
MSTENTAFSTSGEEAIKRTIDVEIDETADHLTSEGFDDFYEIDRTAEEIEQGDFKRIALQFPDELLHVSVSIYRKLKRKVGSHRELYVLADTSYGSCCVDEVAAQHVDADAMIHYGYACMSQTYRLPVFYVFGKKNLDIDDCVARLVDAFSASSEESSPQAKTIVLRHDVVYTHKASESISYVELRRFLNTTPGTLLQHLQEIFRPRGVQVMYSQKQPLNEAKRISEPPLRDCTIFYIGDENLGLTNLLMTHSSCNVISYSPSQRTSQIESGRMNKMLMRRYAVVQKARDADVFGILVGTLGVASYLPLIKHIRALLAASRKKSYTISVGKLNPAKLANFMEIECFVLVACPENSLIDAKDFYRPIITPYELEIALQPEPTWTGRYVLDFEQLLAESQNPRAPQKRNEEEDDDHPVFSLVTGKYRHAKRYGGQANPNEHQEVGSALVSRKDQNGALTKASAASQFLQTRSYQGLEMRLGEDEPSALEQGRSGIAREYENDRRDED